MLFTTSDWLKCEIKVYSADGSELITDVGHIELTVEGHIGGSYRRVSLDTEFPPDEYDPANVHSRPLTVTSVNESSYKAVV